MLTIITTFTIDTRTGRFIHTGVRVPVGSPSAISFVGTNYPDQPQRPLMTAASQDGKQGWLSRFMSLALGRR